MSTTTMTEPGPAQFNLHKYLTITHGPSATTVIGGSATPPQSLNDLIALSKDPATTKKIFLDALTSMPLDLGSTQGSKQLLESIASTYKSSAGITVDNIIAANATSGSNHIVHRSLLKPGDHVIAQYPIYGPLLEEPKDIGCELSYLRLDPSDNWSLDLDQLRKLIKPGKTKLIILNNPANPTGSHISTAVQRLVIQLAKEHDIIIHSDEIFRPLFHSASPTAEIPTSIVEHSDLDYDKVISTSSLSKAYGLSGVRIGWITTRSQELYDKLHYYRMFSVNSLPFVDEIIAAEALGPRCRQGIIDKHLGFAKKNIELIQKFIDEHESQCEWVRPTAGAVAFVKIKDHKTGKAVDDIDFCQRLLDSKGVCMSPGSLCFEIEEGNAEVAKSKMTNGERLPEFQGRVRIHFTCRPENLERGLKGLGEFLQEERGD